MVGYALGNRTGEEEDMDIILEDHPSSVRFSLALQINLFSGKHQKDKFLVPYSVIKVAKLTREQGAREALIKFTDRPDKYTSLNSLFDLWGFNSFVDYIYTISELCFLEGLLPTLEASFLSPKEIHYLSEVISCFKFNIVSQDDVLEKGKKVLISNFNLRYKNVLWALKSSVAVSVSFVVSSNLDFEFYKNFIDTFYQDFQTYGFVNEISVHISDSDFDKFSYDFPLFKKVITYLSEIFQNSVGISVNFSDKLNFAVISKLNISDLGTIVLRDMTCVKVTDLENNLLSISEELSDSDRQLIKRFPLRKEFIRDDKYSKKLGQVFDSFKYRIKKEKEKQNRLKK